MKRTPAPDRPQGPGTPGPFLLVDGHAHLHPSFPIEGFFDGAAENLAVAARGRVGADPWYGLLLLADPAGTDRFGELALRCRGDEAHGGRWRLEPTAEPEALRAHRPGHPDLLLVAGRQIAAADGLEVLALCTRSRFPEGEDLSATVARVRDAGGVPVVPWGFGKWWGARGARVAALLDRAAPGGLLLGDNGGRPWIAPDPPLFRAARKRGIAVLPGSDPLPLPGERGRVGSYGCVLACPEFDPRRPTRALAPALRGANGELERFGDRSGLLRFAYIQSRLRVTGKGARRRLEAPC